MPILKQTVQLPIPTINHSKNNKLKPPLQIKPAVDQQKSLNPRKRKNSNSTQKFSWHVHSDPKIRSDPEEHN